MDKQGNAHINENTYIVSACLAGLNTRFDGSNSNNPRVRSLVDSGCATPFCPEQAGGLPTPREPAEIVNGDGQSVLNHSGRVITKESQDFTDEFVRGAQKMVEFAQKIRASIAILKSKSPSCGCGTIYDGSFSGSMKDGDGVACALLKRAGIEVLTEDDL